MLRFPSLLIMLGCLALAACQPIPHRTLVWNGQIYTAEASLPQVEALVLEGEFIIYAGDLADASTLLDHANTDTIDLDGKTIIPGFVESHGHFMGMGRSSLRLDLSRVQRFEDMVQLVKDSAMARPKGSWILGRGWHQDKWSDQPEMVEGQPVHTALSSVSPDHPVVLTHASGHSILVNQKAMDLAGITSQTHIGEEGEIYHFPNGAPTGLFAEGAMALIRERIPAPTEEEEQQAMEAAIERCLREGVTYFQDAGSDGTEIARFQQAYEDGRFPLRLSVMLSAGDDSLLEAWYQRGPLIGDQFSVRAIKLYADGALGSRGAWLLEEYSDRPGHFGNPVMPMSYISQVSEEGLKHGFQVCTHAIGDRANREVLDIYQSAFDKHQALDRDHRFRIEHAQHLHPEDIPRFSDLGVIASMQGVHLSSDRPWAINRLGRMRIRQGAYMWQSLLKSGAVVINGTDVPVEPLDPMACFYSLVTRKTLAGQPEGGYEADQALTRLEALRAYTYWGAYGGFREGITGSLWAGKYADFLVLSNDIIECPEEDIMDTRVLMTCINGEIVYQAE